MILDDRFHEDVTLFKKEENLFAITFKVGADEIHCTHMLPESRVDLESLKEHFLPPHHPAYLVIRFSFETPGEPPRRIRRLVFVSWVPTAIDRDLKYVHAMEKEKFLRAFGGIERMTEISDASELTEERLRRICQ